MKRALFILALALPLSAETIQPTLTCEPDYILAKTPSGEEVKSRNGGPWFVCTTNAGNDLNPVWIHHTDPEFQAFGAGRFKDRATKQWTDMELIVTDETHVVSLHVHVRYHKGKVEFTADNNEDQTVAK